MVHLTDHRLGSISRAGRAGAAPRSLFPRHLGGVLGSVAPPHRRRAAAAAAPRRRRPPRGAALPTAGWRWRRAWRRGCRLAARAPTAGSLRAGRRAAGRQGCEGPRSELRMVDRHLARGRRGRRRATRGRLPRRTAPRRAPRHSQRAASRRRRRHRCRGARDRRRPQWWRRRGAAWRTQSRRGVSRAAPRRRPHRRRGLRSRRRCARSRAGAGWPAAAARRRPRAARSAARGRCLGPRAGSAGHGHGPRSGSAGRGPGVAMGPSAASRFVSNQGSGFGAEAGWLAAAATRRYGRRLRSRPTIARRCSARQPPGRAPVARGRASVSRRRSQLRPSPRGCGHVARLATQRLPPIVQGPGEAGLAAQRAQHARLGR